MKKGLVSIIIPNRLHETNESLRSIKKQTYKSIQVIEVIDRQHKGASWTRNQGLKKAKGEFIFFCDNDVDLEPECLSNLVKTLQKNKKADWAFGRFMIGESELNIGKEIHPMPEDKNSKEFIDWFHAISTMSLIRASAKPMFSEKMLRFDDWDLWIRLTKAGHNPVFCNELLFKTKDRVGGISTEGDASRIKWRNILYQNHINKIADIIIPHHNRHDLLRRCREGIDGRLFNVIVVSGGSFAENCNKGAKVATTDTLIFLNDDVETEVAPLVALAKSKKDICGITQTIGGKKIYGMGWHKMQYSVAESFFLSETDHESVIPSGHCFMIKNKVWKKLGGFNAKYINGAEDCELFFSAIEKKMSMEILDYPMAHLHSQSEGRYERIDENWKLFNSRWSLKKVKKILKGHKIKTIIYEGEKVLAKSDWILVGVSGLTILGGSGII